MSYFVHFGAALAWFSAGLRSLSCRVHIYEGNYSLDQAEGARWRGQGEVKSGDNLFKADTKMQGTQLPCEQDQRYNLNNQQSIAH